MLFADNDDAAFFQKAVIETYGVTTENLWSMLPRINDILGNLESDIPDTVLALCDTLNDAREFAGKAGPYINGTEPFENFFLRVYPSYLQQTPDTFLATWNCWLSVVVGTPM